MRYILYLFTMGLLFVGGMMVGNIYLPQRAATLAAAVSVPPLSQENPVLQETSRQTAERNLNVLNEALQSCPVVVNEEKDRLVNQIRILLALEDFEIKKARLELEMAKNTDTNRPTSQFTKAVSEYNAAREFAEQLADELFPVPAPKPQETAVPTPDENNNSSENTPQSATQAQLSAKPTAPAKAAAAASSETTQAQKTPAEQPAEVSKQK